MPSPVSARQATLEDLEQMAAIESECYPEPWSEQAFAQEMSKKYARVMVLTDDETDTIVVGYIVYWIQAEGVSLHNIAIHPKWRGFGFARELMRLMINETVREEIPKITLEVRASNKAAIALYASLGFNKTHERPSFYRNGETAIVMEIKTSEVSRHLH
jgi:ribosomal-protein-alanine N-acetyltransferase